MCIVWSVLFYSAVNLTVIWCKTTGLSIACLPVSFLLPVYGLSTACLTVICLRPANCLSVCFLSTPIYGLSTACLTFTCLWLICTSPIYCLYTAGLLHVCLFFGLLPVYCLSIFCLSDSCLLPVYCLSFACLSVSWSTSCLLPVYFISVCFLSIACMSVSCLLPVFCLSIACLTGTSLWHVYCLSLSWPLPVCLLVYTACHHRILVGEFLLVDIPSTNNIAGMIVRTVQTNTNASSLSLTYTGSSCKFQIHRQFM